MNEEMYPMDKVDLKERMVHGTAMFPVSFYELHLGSQFPIVPLHYHEEMEVTYIVSGTATYQCGLHSFTVKAGDFIFMNPHVLHRITQLEAYEMVSYTFVFHINLLKNTSLDVCALRFFTPLLNNMDHLPHKIEGEDTLYEEIRAIFDKLYKCHETKRWGYELLVKGYLLEILGLLYQHERVEIGTTLSPSYVHMDKIKVVLEYIKEHYSESINVNELAELTHLSTYYFMRLFKKYTGMTCVEYINDYRLSKASELLEGDHYTIMQVAMMVGFNNVSYFNRYFKKRFMMTPKAYKCRYNAEKCR